MRLGSCRCLPAAKNRLDLNDSWLYEWAMIIYGKNPVIEIIKRKPEILEEIFFLKQDRDALKLPLPIPPRVRTQNIDSRSLSQMTDDGVHQGIAARIREFPYASLENIVSAMHHDGLLLALDCIQDPQNMGALIRSAAAFGISGVLFPKDRNADITPALVKASAGLCFALPVSKVTNLARTLEELFEKGFWVIGAAAGEGKPIEELSLPGKRVLVIGGEGKGLRRLIKEKCQALVHISTARNVDSLNASVAGAILMYRLMLKH